MTHWDEMGRTLHQGICIAEGLNKVSFLVKKKKTACGHHWKVVMYILNEFYGIITRFVIFLDKNPRIRDHQGLSTPVSSYDCHR